MRCKFCIAKLNHLQIENISQLDRGLSGHENVAEVRCYNPSCREINYLSMDAYFALKEEVVGISDVAKRVDKKLPSEMNILMVSMERSGSSWLAAHISEFHKECYGILPLWNHEISRSKAIRESYELPIGWNSVYDVGIKEVLKRPYDKIILLQKDYDDLCRDLWLYNHPDKTEDDEFMVRLRKSVRKYWDMMFDVEFDDPRLIRLRIEELNNFTFWEMNRLLDHLEFKKHGRCHIMAVNPPDRNWQVYSDLLPTGMKLCGNLRRIQEKYDLKLVEQRIQERLYFAKENEIKDTSEVKYPYVNEVNPYERPAEEVAMEPRNFRIDGDIVDLLDKKEKKSVKKKSNNSGNRK